MSETPSTPEPAKPADKPNPPLSPRATVALEFSKIVFPVVGTIIAACLSGVFLVLTSSGFFERKDPTPTPTLTSETPLVQVVTASPAVTATPAPSATSVPPTLTAIQWARKYEDDFSDPASGWPVVDDDATSKQYSDGGYVVTMKKENIDSFTRSVNAEVLGDVRVEVDALRIGDASPWDIGLACRIDGMNVYQLSVYETNGIRKFGIYRWTSGGYETLAEQIVEDNRVFREGKIANQFRAECVGGHLSLWINGEQVLEATDPEPLRAGKAGIVTGYAKGVQVFFDNFAVYVP